MLVIRDYSGIPVPQCGPPLGIHAGDVIELMFADVHSSWWQVRVTQLMLVLSQHLRLRERITHRLFSVAGLKPRCASSLLSYRWVSHYLQKLLKKRINAVTSTIYLPLAIIVNKLQMI